VNVSHHASGDALDVRNFAVAELHCILEAGLLPFPYSLRTFFIP
jgi:hypothetical protein